MVIDRAARLAHVAELEKMFARARIVSARPLPGAQRGINGIPDLVSLIDDSTGWTGEAVRKGKHAQVPQEGFEWRGAKIFSMQDLVAVAVPRANLNEGVLIERAKGSVTSSTTDIRNALIQIHMAGSAGNDAALAEATALAKIDLQRLVGFHWLMGNSDGHVNQVAVAADQVLTFDGGHIGFRMHRTGDVLTVPLKDALVGVAGLRAPAGIARTGRLEDSAVEALLANYSESEIRAAHRLEFHKGSDNGGLLKQALDLFPQPWNATRSLTRTAGSQSYIDAVVARARHLEKTGEISYVHTDLI